MGDARNHKVSFKREIESAGDYNEFEFVIEGPAARDLTSVIIRVSRSLGATLGAPEMPMLRSLAAKAVEQHILKKVPKKHYVNPERNVILLGSYWYPGHPEAPQTIPSCEGFDVSTPKPSLGFRRREE